MIVIGDSREVLRHVPDNCVRCLRHFAAVLVTPRLRHPRPDRPGSAARGLLREPRRGLRGSAPSADPGRHALAEHRRLVHFRRPHLAGARQEEPGPGDECPPADSGRAEAERPDRRTVATRVRAARGRLVPAGGHRLEQTELPARKCQGPADALSTRCCFSSARASNTTTTRTAVRGPNGRNLRTVWDINTLPYKEAHFATFPPALVEPCLALGSEEGDLVLDPFLGSGTTGEVALEWAGGSWGSS